MSLDYRVEPQAYDLSSAGNQRVTTPGHRIQVISDSTDLSAEIRVSVAGDDLRPSNTFPLKPNGFVEFPEQFKNVDISWDAQAGIEVTVLIVSMPVAPGKFEYSYGGGSIIEGISQAVMITGGKKTEHGKVTVTTTATPIIAADDELTASLAVNNDTQTIYVGGPTVTVADGFPVEPGDKLPSQLRGGVWGIVPTGTADVRFICGKVN